MVAIEPLLNDEYVGLPLKRSLGHILKKRSAGVRGIGVYCVYAPVELIRALGAMPITLCAYAQKTIPDAEKVLPSNLCPLIKSSYGFITTNSCPFFELSEAVVAETTCDGKKKMFELIAGVKPMHIMDLPQIPETKDAEVNWTVMIKKLKSFLEETFKTTITDESIEREIKETNKKNRLMFSFFEYAKTRPPVVNWSEMYDIISLATVMNATELQSIVGPVLQKLDRRVSERVFFGKPDAPRVLVSGCPVNGDSAKALRVIEESGGVVVALEACSGMKPYMMTIEENTSDPINALARSYLTIPCSCMSPNKGRFINFDTLINKFKPDVIVDVILQACHAYNIESYTLEKHVKKNHDLPFLKIETDYSSGDVERIRMRMEALLENSKRR